MLMKTAAVIAEYNPFHSGHMHHLAETRRLHGATHIIAVMSGNFVQRGDCACVSKYVRARMALLGGADLVIELPLPWAVAGAERFALGGAALANALGCVDMLSFGSESGSIELIRTAAQTVDSDQMAAAMREGLSRGESFAAVRQRAAEELTPGVGRILANPNDTLGMEYCRALGRLSSDIEPVCIRRIGAAHDSSETAEHVSASYIRQSLNTGERLTHIPDDIRQPLDKAIAEGAAPALTDRLDRTILYRLRQMSAGDIAGLPDISEGLENRIYKCARTAASFGELCDDIKVKRYTHARIRRIIISALLGLTAQDAEGTPPYIRILGMNERGREILRAVSPTLPVITRYADIESLDERGQHIFSLEQRAGDIFALAMPTPAPCGMDMTEKMIVL